MDQRHGSGVSLITSPSLLTIVLNYRTADLTLQAAEVALREMKGIPGGLTIVDNDSQDGSFERISAEAEARGWLRGGRVQVLQSGVNGGFGAGNNVGIRAGLASGARPDFIYILNSDAWPDGGAIVALMDYLATHPNIGAAGSYIHGPDGEPHSTAFRFPSIAGEFEGAAATGPITRMLADRVVSLPIPTHDRQVDWLAGASVMFRKEVLEEIGLFDEGFFLYFEETELCHRAADAGWPTAYVRNSQVTHIGSVSTGMKHWNRIPQYWLDSRMRYFVKVHGAGYAAMATLAHVAGALIYRLRMVISRKPRVDPPHFLRDLISHAVRAAFHGVTGTSKARPEKEGTPNASES